ncbi:unnamed protein product [Phytophthora lilii]|uniref:Unnamed protein product n=1 Tax=Phytophthora lilii TaxID=2077276 RepID=A0A9W6WSU6_9STRA|nr:unnamed protein product [Phytophthora lilii]
MGTADQERTWRIARGCMSAAAGATPAKGEGPLGVAAVISKGQYQAKKCQTEEQGNVPGVSLDGAVSAARSELPMTLRGPAHTTARSKSEARQRKACAETYRCAADLGAGDDCGGVARQKWQIG